jgi:hypothetical protein
MGEVKDLFGNIVDVSSSAEVEAEKFPRLPRYAEFMVCAFLTKMGHYCVHVDTIGFDIILDYEGRSYRVDVKSTSDYHQGGLKERCTWELAKQRSIGGGRYVNRLLTSDEVDLLALYHLGFDTVIFVPVLRPMRRISLPASQVRLAGDGGSSLPVAVQQLRSVRSPQADDEGE